jgi:hypothetical protein
VGGGGDGGGEREVVGVGGGSPDSAGVSRQNGPAIGSRMAQILGVPGLVDKMTLA